jgi:hypothetical protein
MVALKVNEKELYVKGIDDKTDKLVFTENPQEAEDWYDDWRAGTRIQFLKTHVSLGNINLDKEHEGYLEKLIPYYVDRRS